MKTEHWSNNTYLFLEPWLSLSEKTIRIATGFFTVQGYNLLQDALSGKRVKLMVGYDETSKERLREKLIDDIMLHLSTWGEDNRRAAVLSLVNQLKKWRDGSRTNDPQSQMQKVAKNMSDEDINNAAAYLTNASAYSLGNIMQPYERGY